MIDLCQYCHRAYPELNATDLENPYTECPGCGATVALPAIRYAIFWKSRSGSKAHTQFRQNRYDAITVAKAGLQGTDDKATVRDRWDQEPDLVFVLDRVRPV